MFLLNQYYILIPTVIIVDILIIRVIIKRKKVNRSKKRNNAAKVGHKIDRTKIFKYSAFILEVLIVIFISPGGVLSDLIEQCKQVDVELADLI